MPGFSPVLPGTNCVTYTRSFSSLNAVAHLLAQERGVPPTVGRQGSQWLGTPRCPLTGAGTLGRGHQGGSAECWAPRRQGCADPPSPDREATGEEGQPRPQTCALAQACDVLSPKGYSSFSPYFPGTCP